MNEIPNEKNVALAGLLGFFFGALGLLYVGWKHALTAFVVLFSVGIVTDGVGLCFGGVLCAIWGVIAAQNRNEQAAAMMSAPGMFVDQPRDNLGDSQDHLSAPPSGSNRCPTCSAHLASDFSFCPECGNEIGRRPPPQHQPANTRGTDGQTAEDERAENDQKNEVVW